MSNKKVHVAFIGRLEKEKGVEILIEAILLARGGNKNIIWHICGDGSFFKKFQELEKYEKSDINLYGHISPKKITEILKNIDIVFMPSLFLETFGLTALESLSHGVPVSGFSQGGLSDFIHPFLSLSHNNPASDFLRIIDTGNFPLQDISQFHYEIWSSELESMIGESKRVHIFTDYAVRVGGAEEYVFRLIRTLQEKGIEVCLSGYKGSLGRWKRIILFLSAPIAFWRSWYVHNELDKFNPDLVWIHSSLRYLGPHGLRSLVSYSNKIPVYMTHHDLGLISLRPSQIYTLNDIPEGNRIAFWLPKNMNIISIIVAIIKWTYIRWMWYYIVKLNCKHYIPSGWMQKYIQSYTTQQVHVFPHTYQQDIDS